MKEQNKILKTLRKAFPASSKATQFYGEAVLNEMRDNENLKQEQLRQLLNQGTLLSDRLTSMGKELTQLLNQRTLLSNRLNVMNNVLTQLMKRCAWQEHTINSIFSLLQNHVALSSQDSDVAHSDYYLYISRIHELMKCYEVISSSVEKVHCGLRQDGGYVQIKPYSRTPIAYSFGIGDSISWDKQMADEGYQIYMYDHTISSLPHSNPAYHWKRIGLTGGEESDEMKNLSSLIEMNGHADTNGMLLKMDIEGYEWGVFSNISSSLLEKFDQIVIEMHQFTNPIYMKQVIPALETLNRTHAVVHLHINNHDEMMYCGDLSLPFALEVTYVKRDLYQLEQAAKYILPDMGLDYRNRPLGPDYWAGKW